MTKIIELLGKKIALQQPDGGFQTSIDAVLLASAAPVKASQSVLDLGCGVGAAGLCVLARVADAQLTGVELLERESLIAQENAILNKCEAKIICADIREYNVIAPSDRFDHVICNPPYLQAGAHLNSPDAAKARAMGHVDPDVSLQDWLSAAHRNLKSNGSLTMIHRADELDKIIQGLGKRFGAIEIMPLWPKQGRNAKRVIVRAIKDRQTPLTLHAGLVLHAQNGDYTHEAEAILRAAQPLF